MSYYLRGITSDLINADTSPAPTITTTSCLDGKSGRLKDTVSRTPNPKSLVACGATLERPAKELLTPIARKVKISHERYYRRELGAQGLRP